jgi:hypothetical protein
MINSSHPYTNSFTNDQSSFLWILANHIKSETIENYTGMLSWLDSPLPYRMDNRASPSVRCDYPSCTSAGYGHPPTYTVRSITQYNLSQSFNTSCICALFPHRDRSRAKQDHVAAAIASDCAQSGRKTPSAISILFVVDGHSFAICKHNYTQKVEIGMLLNMNLHDALHSE